MRSKRAQPAVELAPGLWAPLQPQRVLLELQLQGQGQYGWCACWLAEC